MPLYEYICELCNHRQESIRRVEDRDNFFPCANCGWPSDRLASECSFRFGRGGSSKGFDQLPVFDGDPWEGTPLEGKGEPSEAQKANWDGNPYVLPNKRPEPEIMTSQGEVPDGPDPTIATP